MTRAKAGREASLGFGGEPDGHFKNHPPESRKIVGTVDSARRTALVRQVPPTEESAESAAKERQCERSHQSKECDECATRVSAEEGESLEWNKNDSLTQLKEGQLGKISAVLKECCINRPCPYKYVGYG